MPLTPEDTRTENDPAESKTDAQKQSGSRSSGLPNSKYLKPLAALLVAAGAGFLVRRWRGGKSSES
jgi:hypothetical protein